MCVGLPVIVDTHGFMLSLGLGNSDLIEQTAVQAELRRGAATHLNIAGNH